MFLIDRLLIGAPIAGLKFVFRQIANMAEQELADTEAIREDLFALHRAYEQGALDEETYASEEKALMARWRAAQARRLERR
jgi:hypothetical protein